MTKWSKWTKKKCRHSWNRYLTWRSKRETPTLQCNYLSLNPMRSNWWSDICESTSTCSRNSIRLIKWQIRTWIKFIEVVIWRINFKKVSSTKCKIQKWLKRSLVNFLNLNSSGKNTVQTINWLKIVSAWIRHPNSLLFTKKRDKHGFSGSALSMSIASFYKLINNSSLM